MRSRKKLVQDYFGISSRFETIVYMKNMKTMCCDRGDDQQMFKFIPLKKAKLSTSCGFVYIVSHYLERKKSFMYRYVTIIFDFH